jgi:3-hydroxyacyl-CoA dehydrogenase
MDLDQKLTHVTVLGAAGKMGSGITLLLAQEMARLSLLPENRDRAFRLHAVDLSPEALAGLRKYIHAQAVKAAEKGAVGLREVFAQRDDLVENAEVIDAFVQEVDAIVWPTTELAATRGSQLVFEAVVERIPLKVDLLRQVRELSPEAMFFTNTSSVPIGLLDKEAGLSGNVIGFHFYNPPAVQKLVEVIAAETTTKDVNAAAQELGKRLRKKLIPSADVAGFIGNGHFIRDGLHGLNEAARLARETDWPQAAYMVNRVTQEWLLRPMGIFQLIDYVGIDVFKFIQDVMDRFLEEDLSHATIDRMLELGVAGGQKSDGSQKPGFFSYERGKPVAVYDLERRDYVPLADADWKKAADERLGALPDGFRPWKALLGDPKRGDALAAHFGALEKMDTAGAELACGYVERSRQIGQQLVDSGVAAAADDVNGVLTSGFFHLYGPINDYCKGRTQR